MHNLTPAQKTQVEQAIAAAERTASCEFVVVVARQSGRWNRAVDACGLIGGATALVATGIGTALAASTPWWSWSWGWPGALAVFGLGWSVGILAASRFPRLAIALTPEKQVQAEVQRSGIESFHRFRVDATQRRSGVLLYVSLTERRAWLCGDSAVQRTGVDFAPACAALVAAMKRDHLADGLTAALKEMSAVLASKFPPGSPPTHELPNTVQQMN